MACQDHRTEQPWGGTGDGGAGIGGGAGLGHGTSSGGRAGGFGMEPIVVLPRQGRPAWSRRGRSRKRPASAQVERRRHFLTKNGQSRATAFSTVRYPGAKDCVTLT